MRSPCVCVVVYVLLATIPSVDSFWGLGMLLSGPDRMFLTNAAAAAATPAAAAAADSRLMMGRQHITTRRASGFTSCEMTGARRAGGGGGVSSLLLGLLVAVKNHPPSSLSLSLSLSLSPFYLSLSSLSLPFPNLPMQSYVASSSSLFAAVLPSLQLDISQVSTWLKTTLLFFACTPSTLSG